MKIENLTEMAIPVAQGPKVWKEINDLLNKNDYKAAAELYIKSGGNVRGAKRTWNVAQANNKIAGGKVPGPIYGMIDKKHSYDKFVSAMPTEEQAPKKNRERNKPIDTKDASISYKTLADKRKVQALNIKDGNSAGADLSKKMIKAGVSDPVKKLEGDAKRLSKASKGIKEYEALSKRDEAGEKLTLPERKKLSTLKRETLDYRTKKGTEEQIIRDFKEANNAKEITDILNDIIKKKIRIDNRQAVVDLLKKIKKVSKGNEAVELSLLMKRVFRSKKNDKSIEKLINKAESEIDTGIEHLKEVDSILDKYNKGDYITKKDLTFLVNSINLMLPTMKSDRKYDLKGYTVYSNTAKKINSFLDSGKELTADDTEEILGDVADYQEQNVKEIEKKKKKAKRSLKEDILYNL